MHGDGSRRGSGTATWSDPPFPDTVQEDGVTSSKLAGEIDIPLHTRSSGASGTSHSISTQRLPVLPIDKIRTLPAGRALVLARRCAPVEVELQPFWKHPDYRPAHADEGAATGLLRRATRRFHLADVARWRRSALPSWASHPTQPATSNTTPKGDQ
jgi:type IV secretory pathway TraG/TraD family ATPase VirD4